MAQGWCSAAFVPCVGKGREREREEGGLHTDFLLCVSCPHAMLACPSLHCTPALHGHTCVSLSSRRWIPCALTSTHHACIICSHLFHKHACPAQPSGAVPGEDAGEQAPGCDIEGWRGGRSLFPAARGADCRSPRWSHRLPVSPQAPVHLRAQSRGEACCACLGARWEWCEGAGVAWRTSSLPKPATRRSLLFNCAVRT